MRLRTREARAVWWSVANQTWVPRWNEAEKRVKWEVTHFRFFTVHHLAIRFGMNVKAWNVHVLDHILPTRYVARTRYERGAFLGDEVNECKQDFYYNRQKDGTTKRVTKKRVRRGGCKWMYCPTEDGFTAFVMRFGLEALRMEDTEKLFVRGVVPKTEKRAP